MGGRIQMPLLFVAVLIGIIVATTRFFDFQDGVRFKSAARAQPIETFYRIQYVVEEGDTWGVLSQERLGLDSNLSQQLFDASEDVHSLVSIRAGQPLELRYDKATDEFRELRYELNNDEILVITRLIVPDEVTGGVFESFRARVQPITYDVSLVKRSGVITSSLFETALAQGIPEEIILDMAWIFSWDIDFNTAIREGDSFEVVYEDRFRDGERVKPGRVVIATFLNDGEAFDALYYVNPDGDGQYYNSDGEELRRQFLRAPLDYRRISSGYTSNRRVEVLNYFGSHRAIDYAASPGTPVSSTADGTVTFIGWNGDHGRHIRIKHGNGYSTGYSHLSAYAKGMAVGKRIKQNDIIGFVGSSGLSTGPHLHYEMRLNGGLINPLSLDLPPGEPLSDELRADFESHKQKLLALLKA